MARDSTSGSDGDRTGDGKAGRLARVIDGASGSSIDEVLDAWAEKKNVDGDSQHGQKGIKQQAGELLHLSIENIKAIISGNKPEAPFSAVANSTGRPEKGYEQEKSTDQTRLKEQIEEHKEAEDPLNTEQIGMMAVSGHPVAQAGAEMLNTSVAQDRQVRDGIKRDISNVLTDWFKEQFRNVTSAISGFDKWMQSNLISSKGKAGGAGGTGVADIDQSVGTTVDSNSESAGSLEDLHSKGGARLQEDADHGTSTATETSKSPAELLFEHNFSDSYQDPHSASDRLVVPTEQQSEGKIQIGRRYYSPDQLIASSIVPNVPHSEQGPQLDSVLDDRSSQTALRDDYYNRHQYKQEADSTIVADKTKRSGEVHEKLIPKDGDNLTLEQIINEYKTPFIDAYKRSKQLKDGEPGKSKTLEGIVDRLKACPWADQIRIKFDFHVDNPEYNPVESTITIRPQESAAKQIELFTHEGFHATHQALKQMYMGDKPLEKAQYAEVLGGLEAKTFEAEINVHNELTGKMGAGPITYQWRDAEQRKQPAMDLGRLYASKGLDGIKHFLLNQAHTDMQLDGQSHSWNYRTYYEATQPKYANNWKSAHDELERRFKQDPTLKTRIKNGSY